MVQIPHKLSMSWEYLTTHPTAGTTGQKTWFSGLSLNVRNYHQMILVSSHPHLLHLIWKQKYWEAMMSSSPTSYAISKLTALIVAITMFSGQQTMLLLSNSIVIQVKEAFTETHFPTRDDLRLCRIKLIKPEKGFAPASQTFSRGLGG